MTEELPATSFAKPDKNPTLHMMFFTILCFLISVYLFPDCVQTFHISIRKREQKAPSWGKSFNSFNCPEGHVISIPPAKRIIY